MEHLELISIPGLQPYCLFTKRMGFNEDVKF